MARANRYAGAAAARASIARIVLLVGSAVALIIIAGIVLVVLGANHSNEIVKAVHDAGRFLVGPFDHLFSFKHKKVSIGVNWGIAAVVWYAIGRVITRLLLRA